jgi:hypothetical protein
MKSGILTAICILLIYCSDLKSQKITGTSSEYCPGESITLEYDTCQKVFKVISEDCKIPTKDFALKQGKSYKLKFTGLNTGLMSIDSKIKQYNLVSNSPEILKPIFQLESSPINSKFLDSLEFNEYTKYRDSVIDKNSEKSLEYLDTMYKRIMANYAQLQKVSDYYSALTKNMTYRLNNVLANQALVDIASSVNMTYLSEKDFPDLAFKLNALANENVEIAAYFKQFLFKSQLLDIDLERAFTLLGEVNLVAGKSADGNYIKELSVIKRLAEAKLEFASVSIQTQKDLIEIDVDLKEITSGDSLVSEKIVFYTYGGWTFDFTAGLFYNSLVNNQYYKSERDSTTSYIRSEPTIENFDIAAGGLLHLSYKMKNLHLIGFNAGAAVSLFDQKLRFLLGGSYLTGKRNRIGISAGVAFSRLKEISEAAISDDGGNYIPTSNDIPTYDDLKVGGYFGISYNITQKK